MTNMVSCISSMAPLTLRELRGFIVQLRHLQLPVGQEKAMPECAEHEKDAGFNLPGSGVEPRGADAQRPAQVIPG